MPPTCLSRRAFLGAAPLLGAAAARSQPAPRPNVLLILADDLGYGELSCYGAPDTQTPHLDSIAQQGVRFQNFYSNSPVCSPTRAALLSGLYPDRAGVPGVIRLAPEDSWGYLSPRVTLLPQQLQQSGYRTSLVGKWHLGVEPENLPNARGFDRFQGMLGGMLMSYYSHDEHMGKGPDMWADRNRIAPQGHATDIFRDWAVQEIELAARDPRPFFLYTAFNAPHDPVQPPPDWLERVKARAPELSPQRAALVALIEHMDDAIGRILKALRASGRDRDTLVIFSSDNGGLLHLKGYNGKWRGGKGDVYEGGIRVPAVAMWPGRIPAGSSTPRVSLSMDLAATIAEATGVAMPSGIDGRSALPAMLGSPGAEPARDLYWTRREGNARYQGRTIDAVRRGDWKLLQNTPFQPLELYNLADDPYEQRNLATSHRERFDELAALLRRRTQIGGAIPWQKLP